MRFAALQGYVFGWASQVFSEDHVSHENTRHFTNLRWWTLIKISLRYTLSSHICSFPICIAFALLILLFYFVPFSQQMEPPDNFYYTPWVIGFKYDCNNLTTTFLAPLFCSHSYLDLNEVKYSGLFFCRWGLPVYRGKHYLAIITNFGRTESNCIPSRLRPWLHFS